jgi:hypothetical protein
MSNTERRTFIKIITAGAVGSFAGIAALGHVEMAMARARPRQTSSSSEPIRPTRVGTSAERHRRPPWLSEWPIWSFPIPIQLLAEAALCSGSGDGPEIIWVAIEALTWRLFGSRYYPEIVKIYVGSLAKISYKSAEF